MRVFCVCVCVSSLWSLWRLFFLQTYPKYTIYSMQWFFGGLGRQGKNTHTHPFQVFCTNASSENPLTSVQTNSSFYLYQITDAKSRSTRTHISGRGRTHRTLLSSSNPSEKKKHPGCKLLAHWQLQIVVAQSFPCTYVFGSAKCQQTRALFKMVFRCTTAIVMYSSCFGKCFTKGPLKV